MPPSPPQVGGIQETKEFLNYHARGQVRACLQDCLGGVLNYHARGQVRACLQDCLGGVLNYHARGQVRACLQDCLGGVCLNALKNTEPYSPLYAPPHPTDP